MAWRLVAFAAPLCALLLYAQHSFEHARTQQHHGDTGLGIALLLGMLTLCMLVAFAIDLVWQVTRRAAAVAAFDALIVGILLVPFGWVGCNWHGLRNPACSAADTLFGAFVAALEM